MYHAPHINANTMKKGHSLELNAYSLLRGVRIDRLASLSNKLYPDMKYKVEHASNVDELSPPFAKLKSPTPSAYLMAELNSDWTILLDDQTNSDGCTSMMYNFNRLFQIEGFHVAYNRLGICFSYYTPRDKRVINAYEEDGKWVFYQVGDLLAFENEAYYRKKRISDRFNRSVLAEYELSMGIPEIDRQFSKSTSVYRLRKVSR